MNLDQGNANETPEEDSNADLSDDFEPNPRKAVENGLRETVCKNTAGKSDTNFLCSYCDKIFKTPKTLKSHKLICSKNPSVVKYNISCESCGTCFARKDNLVRHKKHCDQQASGSHSRTRHRCLFSKCGAKFWHKTALVNHLKASHEKASKILPVQNLKFTNWEEFLNWKDEEERRQLSYFSEQFGEKDGRTYFYCQQDGPVKRSKPLKVGEHDPEELEDESDSNHASVSSSKPPKKKSANKKGKMKIGFMCIAMMKVLKSDQSVEVEYHPTHNHELCVADLKHQPISNATNSYIKKLLLVGASPRKILKNLKGDKFSRVNRSTVQQLTRNDFIQVKTLRERKRQMASAGNLASDDATAVHMHVELLQAEDYSPVLIYKPFGHELVYGPDSAKSLPNDIFMLGLQTKEQAEMMKLASETIFIVDATHDMDQYSCQLLNVMGVDELNRGYPLAHCISSKMDEHTLKYFFEAIKAKIPDLNVNCVITDDDPALINSMNCGFNELLRHILCDWHFKRTMQKELHKKVKDSELEDFMFKELCVIIDCLLESEFNLVMQYFIEKYLSNKKTKAFIDYFKQYCIHKRAKWAKCFRRFPHGNVETTMFVEAFHNILKTVYLKRKPNKRIDSLLKLLLDVEEDYYCRRQTTICTVAPREQYMQDISARHTRGIEISSDQVQEFDENGSKFWQIKSQSHPNEVYKVFKISSVCTQPHHCYFECHATECHQNLCAHMYMCTCPDDFVLCKHIHRVHSAFGEATQNEEKMSGEVDFYYNPMDDDATTDEIQQRADQRREKEEQEMVQLISQLSNFVKHDAVKNLLYPHLKAVLKGALAQCETVVNGVNSVDMPLQQMAPTVQITSCEKLKRQIRPFMKKKMSKKEIQRKRSKVPKLLEKIEIKKNLLDAIDKQSVEVDVSHNVQRYGSVPTCDDDPQCVEVPTCENDEPQCFEVCTSSSSQRPKVKFVARPIFVPGKSSKLVDKQTPIV
ncbi:uncharacterized protein LOC117651133 [Thrips palmi]|uniref:Uncharacterized protein LOC117651133 n=1 Tax=Thrips palmi TaxID=161013 RepID=A0A6P9A0F9_THRPL|nr:uncharacterized protein LOC117651133 [Thrips palmi]